MSVKDEDESQTKNFAFEQVETKFPLVADAVREFAEEEGEPEEWLIEWEGGDSRTTTMDGMAFYASELAEDGASVTPL